MTTVIQPNINSNLKSKTSKKKSILESRRGLNHPECLGDIKQN